MLNLFRHLIFSRQILCIVAVYDATMKIFFQPIHSIWRKNIKLAIQMEI